MRTTYTSRKTQSRPANGLQLTMLAFCTAGALLVSSAAAAGPGMSGAQAQYQKDRAACMSGSTNQDRATCLKEAGAALVEARRGGLSTTDESTYVKNSMDRCVPLPAADHEDCVRRMQGEGMIQGSVEGGGIYRELRRTVPLSQANQ